MENRTLDTFEIGELYVTGPGCRLFVKLPEGNVRDVVTGKVHQMPGNRLGHSAGPEDFVRTANQMRDHKLFHLP